MRDNCQIRQARFRDVPHATTSAFKNIKIGQVVKSNCYSSEPHDLRDRSRCLATCVRPLRRSLNSCTAPLVCKRGSQTLETELEWTVPHAGVETGPVHLVMTRVAVSVLTWLALNIVWCIRSLAALANLSGWGNFSKQCSSQRWDCVRNSSPAPYQHCHRTSGDGSRLPRRVSCSRPRTHYTRSEKRTMTAKETLSRLRRSTSPSSTLCRSRGG